MRRLALPMPLRSQRPATRRAGRGLLRYAVAILLTPPTLRTGGALRAGRALLRTAIAILLLVAPAAAQTLRIEGAVPVTLRAGPGDSYPVAGELYPGEQAERGPCDEMGRWCVVSTDRTWGWLDTGLAATAPRPDPPRAANRSLPSGLARGLGPRGLGPPGLANRDLPPGLARGLAPPPAVTVTPLPPQGGGARPLPPGIIAAVPPAPVVASPAPVIVPGARPPLLLSTIVPLRNVTDGYVNLRAGPGTDSAIVGRLAPGEGGRIDLCDALERWCRIAAEGQPQAWVLMRLVGLRRL